MKLKPRFTYPKFFITLSLTLLVLGAGFWAHRARPFSHFVEMDRDGNEKGELSPKLLQAWFNRGRRSPDNHPAAFYRLRALDQKSRLPLARPVYQGGGSAMSFRALSVPPSGPSCDWTELGPAPENDSFYGNISGRVVSLALDLTHDPTGNTLYLGAAYGGVWKSTNALAASPTFLPISDQTQSLAMGSLALDTSVNPPIIYEGTGELNMAGDSYYGAGILNSTNGGANWTLVSTANGGTIPFLGLACSKILVDPSSPATVLAAMGFACCHDGVTNLNQGIYRSTDSGASWTQISTVNGGGQAIAGHSFTDVIYDGSATFYAAVRFQGVYKSTDHGLSWTQLSSPFPSGTAPSLTNFARATLAFRGGTIWCLVSDSSENPSAPTGADTGLSQSIDGGNTWTAVSLPVVSGGNVFDSGFGGQGTYDQYVAAPPGTTSLLVAGIDLFFASTVNGTSTSWTNLTNVYSGNPASHPDQHAIAFSGASTWIIGNDGGVWTTANAGGAFKDINNNLGTIQFYGIDADPSKSGAFLGGTQDNGTPYTNGGVSWTEVAGGDGGYVGVNSAILGQFYGENFGIGLYRVDNFGSGFATVIDKTFSPISTDNAAILVPFKVIPGSNPQVVYGTSRVWRGPGNASNGAGWVTISNFLTGSNSGSINSLGVAPSNSNFIYATTDDGAATPTYQVYSNGGGGTWNNISTGLPTTNPLVGIAVDPMTPAKAYVGVMGFVGSLGTGHVYQTSNGGGSWTDITGNLPDAPVNAIVVDPQASGDIYVATDVGVFATQNVNGGGTNWARMGTLLPDSTVLDLKMSVTCPRVIVAGTHGRGAWSICPLSGNGPCPSPTATPTPVINYSAAPPVLFPNPYPDPKSPGVPPRLLVTLSSVSDIKVRIFTEGGRKVRDENFPQVAVGPTTLTLDLKDNWGTSLANSLYYVAVDTSKDHYILKLLVLR